jgi:hypothetical protein
MDELDDLTVFVSEQLHDPEFRWAFDRVKSDWQWRRVGALLPTWRGRR